MNSPCWIRNITNDYILLRSSFTRVDLHIVRTHLHACLFDCLYHSYYVLVHLNMYSFIFIYIHLDYVWKKTIFCPFNLI